jgi:hypothetical protein
VHPLCYLHSMVTYCHSRPFPTIPAHCKHPKFSPSFSVYISYVVACHYTHLTCHFTAFQGIACHCISLSRSRTPVFQNIESRFDFKTFLSKAISNTWVLNQHLTFANPQDLIFRNVFLRKQSGFILNSVSMDFNSLMRPI